MRGSSPALPTPPNVPPPLHRSPTRKLRPRGGHVQEIARPHRPAGRSRQQDHHPNTRRRWQAERAGDSRISRRSKARGFAAAATGSVSVGPRAGRTRISPGSGSFSDLIRDSDGDIGSRSENVLASRFIEPPCASAAPERRLNPLAFQRPYFAVWFIAAYRTC